MGAYQKHLPWKNKETTLQNPREPEKYQLVIRIALNDNFALVVAFGLTNVIHSNVFHKKILHHNSSHLTNVKNALCRSLGLSIFGSFKC